MWVPQTEAAAPVWGDGERPAWLVSDELQPKKREWSPARDRMEAELELKAGLQEQRRLRRRRRFGWLGLPFIWTWSLLKAIMDVSRNRTDAIEAASAEVAAPSSEASLDTLPGVRPFTPPEAIVVAPAPALPATAPEAPAGEVAGPEAPAPPAEPPGIDWPESVPAAPEPSAPGPAAPHRDWRPQAAPPPPAPEPPAEITPASTGQPAPPDWGWEPGAQDDVPAEVPATEPGEVPPGWEETAARVPPPAAEPPPPPPVGPAAGALGAGETVRAVLDTCMRSSGAEVGMLVLLHDAVLVLRALSGIEPEIAAKLALDTLGDLCLDVIASGKAYHVQDTGPATPDPYHPRAILCAPVMLGATGVGVVLLAGYAPGAQFTDEHERFVSTLAVSAGPVLAGAGAYQLDLDRPGDRWRRLDQPAAPAPGTGEIGGSPLRTMTLDPEVMHRLIAHAKAARMAQEVATLVLPKPAPAPAPPVPEAVEVRAATEPLLAPPVAPVAEPELPAEVAAEVAAEVPAEIVPEEEVSEPAPRPAKARHGPGWRARVSSRMTRITEQREEDRATYRREILAAVRNLSWDGYTALIADVYRRKAFEVFPPPATGSDLDVIDLVVDRDGQRMLVNCQLRGEMAIPIAAVTEMATVVANYSVSGAYLIADGSFGPDAEEAAPRGGVVLIDGEALIDLVIETTLKDERKPSVGGRLARVFAKKN